MIALLLAFTAGPFVPAVDGLGDPLPEHAVARLGSARLLVGTGGPAAISPDGSRIAAFDGGVLLIFDAAGRRRDAWLFSDRFDHSALTFSPEGKHLAVSGWRRLNVYDVATGNSLLSWGDPLGPAAFARDGRLAAGLASGVALWALPDTKPTAVDAARRHPPAVALSPDGKTLAAWGDESEPRKTRGIRLYDTATRKERLAIPTDRVHHALFTPDGAALLAAADRQVTLYDAKTGKPTWRRDLVSEDAPLLRLSADGKQLLTADDGYGRILDARSGKRLAGCVLPPGSKALDARFTPDGAVVLGRIGQVLFLWDVRTGRPRTPLDAHVTAVQAVAFSRDGREVISAAADGVRRWSLAKGTGEEVLGWRREENWQNGRVWLSPTGRVVVHRPAAGAVTLFDAASGRRMRDLAGATLPAVAFSRDESRIVGVSGLPGDRSAALTLRLYSGRTGTELRRVPLPVSPRTRPALALSDDASVLACAGPASETIPSFAIVRGGEPTMTIEARELEAIAFSSCGRWLGRVGSTGVELLDARTGAALRWLSEGAEALAFSPDGWLLAVAGAGAVRVIELASGGVRWRLDAANPKALAFSPDGRLLAVADGAAVVVHDVTGRAARREIARPDARTWAALGGDTLPPALLVYPAEAVALIRSNLRPAPGKPLSEAEIRRHIRDLGDDDFAIRERASKALAVPSALPLVEAAAKTESDLEARRRLQRLITDGRTWPGPGMLPVVRAIEVLERVGTPEARRLLGELSEGNPDARLTQEAKAAVTRLGAAGGH